MGVNINSKLFWWVAKKTGNILVFLRPKKAQQLSENRITLVHLNKNNLSLQEKLMRYALVQNLEKIKNHDKIAELNKAFWIDKSAAEHFALTKDSFENTFLPHCTFILDELKQELSKQSEKYHTLVEIGTGNGKVLNYLSFDFSEINHFVGIDLSPDQIEINKQTFSTNKKLEFVACDAFDWVTEHGQSNTIFISCNGVLEYFLEHRLQEFLNEVHKLQNVFFVAIEPNGIDHDFEKQPNTQLYGDEPSFSHNYPKLFKNAGFNIWHFSQRPWPGGSGIQTIVGAKN